MKKKYYAVWLAAAVLLMSVAGCGGSKEYAADTSASAEAPAMESGNTYDYSVEEAAEYEDGTITSDSSIEAVTETGRKLIKTVRLEMQTKEFDTVVEGLSQKVQEVGGYVESSSVWGSSYYSSGTRSSDYTVRIPSNRLDEFIQVVSGLGNVTYKSESVEDVTLQYVDVESRQKALETEQERLLQLMEQAENLEDLLTIESRLSEVRYQLENFGSQKRLLDNQIDYSTVSISVSEVERITETRELNFFEEIASRFGDSLYAVGRGLRGFVIGFVGALPILAVWAAVIALFVLAVRRIFYGKKKEKKREKRWFQKKETPQEHSEEQK